MTHGGGEHSVKMLALQFFRFGCNNVLKVRDWEEREKIALSISELMKDKCVSRTALASPGLLMTPVA